MFVKLRGGLLAVGIGILVHLGTRPYHDGRLQLGLPVALTAVWIATLMFLWRWKIWRSVVMALPVVAAVPFCLPGKAYDVTELRSRYVDALKKIQGSPYIWGGECRQGIDCSGLPRRALREALLDQGVRHGNGAAFRQWAEQWWFDTSAKAMAEGYRGFTRPLGISGRLRELDSTRLEPGDLAVTAGRQHVMVYAGNGEWIQADPRPGKVVIGNPVTDPNPWFISAVTVHRWVVLP